MAEYNGRYIPDHVRLDLPKREKKSSGGNKGNNKSIVVQNGGREYRYSSIKDFLSDSGINQTTFHHRKKLAKDKGKSSFTIFGWEIKYI